MAYTAEMRTAETKYALLSCIEFDRLRLIILNSFVDTKGTEVESMCPVDCSDLQCNQCSLFDVDFLWNEMKAFSSDGDGLFWDSFSVYLRWDRDELL